MTNVAKQELYTRIVKKLNEVTIKLDTWQKRCDYLKDCMDKQLVVHNTEQAEAYSSRIIMNQVPIDKLCKEILELKDRLEDMPRVYIA